MPCQVPTIRIGAVYQPCMGREGLAALANPGYYRQTVNQDAEELGLFGRLPEASSRKTYNYEEIYHLIVQVSIYE